MDARYHGDNCCTYNINVEGPLSVTACLVLRKTRVQGERQRQSQAHMGVHVGLSTKHQVPVRLLQAPSKRLFSLDKNRFQGFHRSSQAAHITHTFRAAHQPLDGGSRAGPERLVCRLFDSRPTPARSPGGESQGTPLAPMVPSSIAGERVAACPSLSA